MLKSSVGPSLGTLTTTYDIQPNAEVTVNWNLAWSAGNTNLWEAGVKLSVPAALTHMRWSRDAVFTDYSTGWIGEPSGQCQAGDIQFRASKRKLQWLTLTDGSGQGLALLPVAGTNLISRANATAAGDTILFASTGVSGPRDFSGSWVADQEVKARHGKSLTGAFTLRAVVP